MSHDHEAMLLRDCRNGRPAKSIYPPLLGALAGVDCPKPVKVLIWVGGRALQSAKKPDPNQSMRRFERTPANTLNRNPNHYTLNPTL